MIYYVYKITNIINGKYYIGKRKNPNPALDSYMGSGKLIKLAIKKYGRDSFKKEILAEFKTNKEAASYESNLVTRELIESGNCYNMHEGGHGGFLHINAAPPDKRVNFLSLKQKIKTGEIVVGGTQNWTKESFEKVRLQSKINREKNSSLVNSPEAIAKKKKTMALIKHQQGSKNSQYGKKWCVKADATDLNNRKSFKQIPKGWITTTEWKEKRKDKTNSTYGTIWITNGKQNKLIHKNETIPINWKRGRLMNIVVRS